MILSSLRPQVEKIFGGFDQVVAGIYVDAITDYTPCSVYLRKSIQRDDKDAESIASQLFHGNRQAGSRRWVIVAIYVDENISAYSGDDRPDFNRLRDDMRNGVPHARNLIVREQSRLTRAKKLSFSIALFEDFTEWGVEAYSSDGEAIKEGLLSTIKSVSDQQYAANVAKANKDKAQLRAAAGKHTKTKRRPDGYASGYTELVHPECDYLDEARQRFTSGEKLDGIIKSFKKRGIKTSMGNDFTSSRLSKALRRPENAGMRSYKPNDGPMEVTAHNANPAIWTEEQHWAMMAVFEKNQPFNKNNARKYMLSGVLLCTECGGTLAARVDGRYPAYYCNPNRGGCAKVSRSMRAIDNYLTELTYKAILRLPPVRSMPMADNTTPEIEKLEAMIDESRAAYKAQAITLIDFADIRKDCEAKIRDLRKQQNKTVPLPVSSADAFRAMADRALEIVGKAELTDEEDADLRDNRAKLRATILRMWGRIGVKPAPKKGAQFHPDQLVFDTDA